MRISQMKSILLLVVLCTAAVAVAVANENPAKPLVVEDKVKIIDNSRLLTREEVDKMEANERNSIPVVVPLLKKPMRPIEPKIAPSEQQAKPSDQQQPQDEEKKEQPSLEETGVRLPPIPLIMPSFLNNIFDSPVSSDSAPEVVDSDKPKGIVNVLVVKSQHAEDSSSSSSGDQASAPQVRSSLIIFRIIPKSISSMFGFGDEDEATDSSKLLGGGDNDPDKKRSHPHMLGGGDNDPDKKRRPMHMMLGGESDPDRLMRFDVDESNKGVFTGGKEDVYASPMGGQHRMFVFSMFDRMRSMFDNMRQSMEQRMHMMPMMSDDDVDDDDNEDKEDTATIVQDGAGLGSSLPFISIRTEDGHAALIPNDFEKQQANEQSLNKCMMLQFMRLKASMYYRTILHLLFFTGVLLFIFSLLFLIVRTCRRRRFDRRRHHHHHHHHHHRNMSISSIEAAPAGAKSKLAAYKAWQGMDQSSLIEPSDKVVLIQAPPAYDQVFIHDKNSTLTSSDRRQSAFSSDECETKSLPPDYEEEQQQQQSTKLPAQN